MDVETVLNRRGSLIGKEILVRGILQAAYFKLNGGWYGKAWMVQDNKVSRNSGKAILIVRPGLVNLLEDTFNHRYGGLPHSYRSQFNGTLTDSTDVEFPAALMEIGKCEIEGTNKVAEFDFLRDKDKWRSLVDRPVF